MFLTGCFVCPCNARTRGRIGVSQLFYRTIQRWPATFILSWNHIPGVCPNL